MKNEYSIQNLAFLIGSWKGNGVSYGLEGKNETYVERKDSFTWFPGKFFIVAYDILSSTDWGLKAHWVFGFDKDAIAYNLFTFDSIGFQRTYICSGPSSSAEWVFTGDLERMIISVKDGLLYMKWDIRKSPDSHWAMMCESTSSK